MIVSNFSFLLKLFAVIEFIIRVGGDNCIEGLIANRGKVRFKSFEGAMNAAILIDFMKRLVQEARRKNGAKVFLVLDNLKVHHAKPVKAWLAQNKAHIEVFYLPSYSPELNPDEMFNANLKAAVTSKAPNRRKGQLKQAAIGYLRYLQKTPAKVKQLFQKDCVKDAASFVCSSGLISDQ